MSPSSGDALLCFVKRAVPAGSKGTNWYRQDYTQHKVVVPGASRCLAKVAHQAGGYLVILVEELRERGVNFRSLTDAIDTSTPMGRFFFHVMGALAEMERELIVERTKAGLEAARAQGRIGGRRPKLTPEQWAQAGRLIASGVPRQKVAIIYDVGISTLYKKFSVGDK